MNIVFFIGNGLDIRLNMKTRYKDFYDYIFDRRQEGDNVIYKSIRNDINNWADFEISLGKLTKDVSKEEVSKFYDDLQEFTIDFNDYLVEQEKSSVLNDDSYDFQYSFYDTFQYFSSQLTPQEKIIIDEISSVDTENKFYCSFINFNYTRTLDSILGLRKTGLDTHIEIDNSIHTIDINNPVINIHGRLNSHLILGVNDESQVDTKYFEGYNLDYLIKPKIVKENRLADLEQAECHIKNGQIFVIYGMSLGKTDIYWWKLISQRLQSDKSTVLIINAFEVNYCGLMLREKKRITEKWISKYLDIIPNLNKESKEQLRSRIFVIINNPYIFPYRK